MVLTTPNVGVAGGFSLAIIIILPGNARRRGYDSAGTRILDAHL
jgi:hypothetical protein